VVSKPHHSSNYYEGVVKCSRYRREKTNTFLRLSLDISCRGARSKDGTTRRGDLPGTSCAGCSYGFRRMVSRTNNQLGEEVVGGVFQIKGSQGRGVSRSRPKPTLLAPFETLMSPGRSISHNRYTHKIGTAMGSLCMVNHLSRGVFIVSRTCKEEDTKKKRGWRKID